MSKVKSNDNDFLHNNTADGNNETKQKNMTQENFADCLNALAGRRIFALTTKGSSRYDKADFQAGDVFLFGPETRGLPAEILESLPAGQKLRLPMTGGSRSMNLSNTVAVMLFEAWRQLDFPQGT